MQWWVVLLAAAVLGAQAPLPSHDIAPELLQLAKIKLKMADNLGGLPNYTCTEVIERSRRDRPSKRYRLIDVVRLEVALVSGKELFAWPGERNFQDRELGDMVSGGAIGNGNFALHAKAVFLSNTASYTWSGEELLGGRKTLRYDFRIPQFRSGLTLRVGDLKGIAGSRGSFWVDAHTLDLVRLDVIAVEIPSHLPISESSDTMEYARVPIGERDYLLPKSSVMTIVDLTGNESRNRVELSNCRQYSGESRLVFGDAPQAEADRPPAAETFDVPPGLDLEVIVDGFANLDHAAIGDRFSGTLFRDIKQKKTVVIPRRATVTGRISVLEGDRAGGTVFVGLELTEVAFPGRLGRIRAHLLEAGAFPVVETGRLISAGSGPLHAAGTRMPQNLRNVFVIPGNARYRAGQALRTRWRTEAVPKEIP